MKVFLYRLSLTENQQPELFERDEVDRKSFLRRWLCRSFSFDYRKDIKLRYEFIQEDRGAIYAALCRWIPENAENDPLDPFAISEGGRWKKAAFLINLNDDEQVAAVENAVGVGLPNAILAGLVEAINAQTLGEPFKIDAFSLPKEGSFNAAVGAFPGPITAIQFDLVVPNPIDAEGETKEALRKLREKTGAERIGQRLNSEKGLKTDSSYIQEIVEYAENGGGDISAKSGGEEVYDSRKTVRSAELPDEIKPTGSKIENLFNLASEILRR